jgi:hypothetical protein
MNNSIMVNKIRVNRSALGWYMIAGVSTFILVVALMVWYYEANKGPKK